MLQLSLNDHENDGGVVVSMLGQFPATPLLRYFQFTLRMVKK